MNKAILAVGVMLMLKKKRDSRLRGNGEVRSRRYLIRLYRQAWGLLPSRMLASAISMSPSIQ